MSTLFNLTGQVALVTGATGGLGSAIAEQLGASDATVVISDLEVAACEQATQRLRDLGYSAHAAACDVSQHHAVDAMVDAVLERCQRIDVLVCNAGVQGPTGPIGNASDADWERVMDVNLRSVSWLCARAIPAMAARG